jgi:hypothetical protein
MYVVASGLRPKYLTKKRENSAKKNRYDTGFKKTSPVNRMSKLQLFRKLLKT